MYYNHMDWGWAALMTLGWIALVGIFVALVVLAMRERRTASARDVLDRRLAAGEIDVEEYERLRKAMASKPRDDGVAGPAAHA